MARMGIKEASHAVAADAVGQDRPLRYAAFLFAAALLLHGADHLRRGVDVVTPEVFWGGMALSLIAVAAIVLAVAEHRRAPLVAAAVGFSTALAVSSAHLLPRWSAFSDAFPGSAVDALSWAAVLAEIAAALVFGVAGVYALRGRRPIRAR